MCGKEKLTFIDWKGCGDWRSSSNFGCSEVLGTWRRRLLHSAWMTTNDAARRHK